MGRVLRAHEGYQATLLAPRQSGGWWMRADIEPFVPESTALDEAIEAFVNDGRWVVQCPDCRSGQLVDPETIERFFCIECLNERVDRQWVPVRYPAEVEEIEAALSVRVLWERMNWRPGETVEDLRRENREHGITEPVRDERPNESDR